ncbi:polysaccharide deacetylase [Mycolicibacterium duvalii]|uniref:Polysaccharide deacetylase n=1 Tax=Mycolicibacterium duvalii TaxID=39688 RepID=A0A7I7K9A4_9MYCO|nr:polysaccharide deacetylase family protein [Mycolicibacterium duvalii]MCV7366264.1 polysaccharide deacetylase family protein [Mycolicibacterium duvalii]PEG41053.1 polysaccharide deacetylase [Mycolicibacterium duvalii]BBX20091.1 polysaccharide deacetylase [Mycolicibacterium duvalii]
MRVIPVLLYHAVTDDPAGWLAPFTVTPKTFARHVDIIMGSGRTAITVTELCSGLAGRTALPSRPVVITFDDGFADFFSAAQYLASHRLPSTLYVCTGGLRGRGPRPVDLALPPADMLDWSQLAELGDLGVEVGAHTHHHPQLDLMREEAAVDEIRRSKASLEDSLGFEVPSFAYPHGFHSGATRRAVAAAGHTSAAAVMDALCPDRADVYALPRLTVRATTSSARLAQWLTGGGARTAPDGERLRTGAWRMYRRLRGARSTRGVFVTGNKPAYHMSEPETHPSTKGKS